jgi:hypothetical protein
MQNASFRRISRTESVCPSLISFLPVSPCTKIKRTDTPCRARTACARDVCLLPLRICDSNCERLNTRLARRCTAVCAVQLTAVRMLRCRSRSSLAYVHCAYGALPFASRSEIEHEMKTQGRIPSDAARRPSLAASPSFLCRQTRTSEGQRSPAAHIPLARTAAPAQFTSRPPRPRARNARTVFGLTRPAPHGRSRSPARTGPSARALRSVAQAPSPRPDRQQSSRAHVAPRLLYARPRTHDRLRPAHGQAGSQRARARMHRACLAAGPAPRHFPEPHACVGAGVRTSPSARWTASPHASARARARCFPRAKRRDGEAHGAPQSCRAACRPPPLRSHALRAPRPAGWRSCARARGPGAGAARRDAVRVRRPLRTRGITHYVSKRPPGAVGALSVLFCASRIPRRQRPSCRRHAPHRTAPATPCSFPRGSHDRRFAHGVARARRRAARARLRLPPGDDCFLPGADAAPTPTRARRLRGTFRH